MSEFSPQSFIVVAGYQHGKQGLHTLSLDEAVSKGTLSSQALSIFASKRTVYQAFIILRQTKPLGYLNPSIVLPFSPSWSLVGLPFLSCRLLATCPWVITLYMLPNLSEAFKMFFFSGIMVMLVPSKKR